MRTTSVFVAAAAAILLFGCGQKTTADSTKLTIAVIPKGTTHEFWKSIHAGALKAGNELGVEILWKGPQKEDDRSAQQKVVDDFVNRKVSGIVLAPLDDTALGHQVQNASSRGVPVVIIDSGLKEQSYVSFVATDNYKGGALGAERLGTLMGGKGKVIVLRYQENSASTDQREAGFLDTVKQKYPGIELVSSNQYGGATTDSAYGVAQNLLIRFKEGVDGIFCPNESTTFGMLRALQNAKRAGTVKFVGFDGSEKLAEALKAGEIHGLVLQNPMKMGDVGVRTLVDHIRGKPVEKRVDTGVTVATKENMDSPEIRELLTPTLPAEVK